MAALAALAALAAAPVAGAQVPGRGGPHEKAGERAIEGTVVARDGGELVVDLGESRGASDGVTLELWRPLRIKHPVSGKVLVDRFRIGALEVVQARETLSLAKPSGALARKPEVGDVVVLRPSTPVPPAPPAAPAESSAPAAPASPRGPAAPAPAGVDPEVLEIAALFEALRGAPPLERARRYEALVRARPKGRYAAALAEEAATMRALAEGAAPPDARSFSRPEEVEPARPFRIAIEAEGAKGAVLHARRPGELAFRPTPMRPLGPGYFGADVPAAKLAAPRLEYFVEATDARGRAFPIVGTADAPESVRVREVRAGARPTDPEARARLVSDYADYNRLRGNDRAFQTEGDVGVRFGDRGVRALRTGFGVYRGVGGTLAELDEEGLEGRRVGLTYGYLEGELAPSRAFAFIVRGAVGLLEDGVSGGGQLLVRIGSDRETNLVLGGEVLGGVGLRSMVELELRAVERVPVLLRTEVTNQPAGAPPTGEDRGPGISLGRGEVGARAIAQVGYRLVPPLVLALRGSFQGRTIRHAGPGVGVAMEYAW